MKIIIGVNTNDLKVERINCEAGNKYIGAPCSEFIAPYNEKTGEYAVIIGRMHMGDENGIMKIIIAAWGGEPDSFRTENIIGITRFVDRYHISADNTPSLVFPVDTRDYALEGLPSLPPADVCFANVWLGDGGGFADDYTEIGERFAEFMLHYSHKNIIFSHLYETGREDRDMWRREHADILTEIIKKKNPGTRTAVPVPGEIIKL